MKFIFKTNDQNPDGIEPARLFKAISSHLALKKVKYIYECEVHIKDTTFISMYPDSDLLFHSHPDMYHDWEQENALEP